MQKTSTKIILVLSSFLILDPFLRILSFKLSSGLDWAVVWDNIVQNGNVSVFRFMEFWLFTPLAGLFLLTLSRVSYVIYSLLTLYKFYSLVSYTPYDWPYFAARPHAGAFIIITLNLFFVLVLTWPVLKKYIFSYHFKNIWDARGRYDANFTATLYVNGQAGSCAGVVKNISSGGMLLKLTGGSKPQVKAQDSGLVVIETNGSEFLDFEIELVNVTISEHRDLLGMEFTNIDPKKSLALMNLLLDLRAKQLEREKKRVLTS